MVVGAYGMKTITICYPPTRFATKGFNIYLDGKFVGWAYGYFTLEVLRKELDKWLDNASPESRRNCTDE